MKAPFVFTRSINGEKPSKVKTPENTNLANCIKIVSVYDGGTPFDGGGGSAATVILVRSRGTGDGDIGPKPMCTGRSILYVETNRHWRQ